MIKVKLFFVPKDIVGKEEILVSANDLGELLEKMIEDYPKLKEAIFEKNTNRGEINRNIIVLVNGLSAKKLNIPLKEGDTVFIFSAVSGG